MSLIKNREQNFRRFFLSLCFLLSAHFAIAATVSLYVGETYVVDTPNPSSSTGYIDNAAVLQSDKNFLSIDTSDPVNVKITVIKYFSNTAIVKIRFVEKYTYNGHINKVDHDVEVRITTKYPEITPNTETVTLSVGETKKLQYTVKPSGLLDPPITWGPVDGYYPSSLRVAVDENGNVTGKKAGYAHVVGIPYGNMELKMYYVINVTDLEKITLSASVESGYVYAGTKVTLTASIEGADIYYTLDGTTPSASSKKYTSAGITINESCTLKAIAMKSGYKNSSVLTRNYKLKVDANSISIPSTKTIYVADSEQLNYTLQPNNSTSTVTWKSDNTSIATVSSSGLVKGIAEGKTTIRATTSNGKSAACEVTVKKVEATSISLPSSKNVYIGETVTLTYTMTPSNAMSSVTWKSADTSIATVSSSGVVTGKKEGSTNITVTTDNGKSASCKVYVEPKPIDPTKISFSSSSCNVEVGYSTKIRYTLEPENATTTITWESRNTSIATVSSDGIVKGIKEGGTSILATTANGLYDVIWVSVGGFKNGTQFKGTSSDDNDVTYMVTDINTKTCEIHSCNKSVKKVVIPSSVMGYKVTSISYSAFARCEQLSDVSLPNTLAVIRGRAFSGCKSLTSISIPSSVSSIEGWAFGNCDKLVTVTLPNSLTTIGNYAYQGCKSLKSISIPNSVISIGSHVFYGCENMESATLSNSIKRIESYLFYNCKSLKNISGFNNVEYIGASAFYNTPWRANLPNGENYIGKVLLTYKGKMPENTKVKVKDGCTQIAGSAFDSQTGLVSITIPSSLVTLESNPFYRCDSLRSISVSAGNPVFDSRNNCNAIIKTKENELVVGCVTTSIPNTVKSIGRYAFYYSNAALYEVNIPDNVDSIANWAYYYVPNVKKISIGKGLRTMGNRSFWYGSNANSITVSSANPYFDSRDNCNAIIETATNKLILGGNKTEIPNNVKTIGEFAFANNSIISSITIPNSVTAIEEQAFSYMTNLRSITIGKNVKSFGKNILYNYTNYKLMSIRSMINFPTDIDKEVFYKCYKEEDSLYNHITLYIPRGCKANYQSAEGWKNFKHIVEIDDDEIFKGMVFTEKTVEGVELTYIVTDDDKKECELMASPVDVKGKVTIPSSANGFTVRSIGEEVFYSYKNDRALTEVVIPNTIKTFGPFAFCYCEDMIATIPSSVTSIGDYAFSNCKKITADDLSNVTAFGNSAFSSCTQIESIKLGSSVKSIGRAAFYGTGIASITIPKSVESIGGDVCGRCEKLQSIKVEEGNPYYDSRYNCNGIFVKATNTLLAGCMNTIIPEETDTIDNSAFYYHSGLKEIKLPDNLKAIADYAFTRTGLSTITIPESVDSIGKHAFRNCANLTSLKVMSKEPIKINEDVFFYETDTIYTFKNVTLYVPFGTKSLYASADVWKKFKNIEEMSENPYVGMTFKAKTIEGVELTYKVTDVDNKECELIESPTDVKGKVTIPSGIYGYTLTRIGEYAFYIRGAITEVVIPNTIKYIGVCAFFECKNMKGTIPVSVTEIGNVAFMGCTEITASDLSNLCVVRSMAFDGCKKIENIKLGSSLKEIEYGAFMSTGLKEIIIPKSVEFIGGGIFSGCNSLEKIIVEEGNAKYDSRNNSNCVFEKSTNNLVSGCKNTTIPEETKIIGDKAFGDLIDLKTIKMPEGIITIDEFAFDGSGLEEITLPHNAYLGYGAFCNCDNLKVIRALSSSPIKIHENAFCFDDTAIYNNATLYVPFGTKSLYASADVWKNFNNIVEMEQEKIERITVSQFLSKADTKTKFELSGVVKNVANTVYGNFDLEQNGSKVYINGTLDKDGNAQKWGSLGVSEGDSIVLQGVYTTYNSAPAIKNAQYISHRRNMTVNLSKAGYATFYDSKNSFDLPKGLTAKVVTGVSDGKLEYRSLSDNVIPAGVAVMISDNANGGTYTLSQSLSEGRYSGSNLLYGSDETTTTKGDGYHYKLAYGHSGTSLSNVFGWYWGNDYGGAFKSEAHRAWMVVPKSSKTKSFSIEGETTEIVTIDSDDTEGACYDLQGRRVTKPVKNGVYIMNGKTIIVK